MTRYWTLLFLTLIFFFGLHLRLTAVLESNVIKPVRADAKEYITYALNLHAFGVYSRSTDGLKGKANPIPDAARPPSYPLFLTLFVDDSNIQIRLFNVLIVQALLSSLVILLAYALFTPIMGSGKSIIIAALIALSPHLINLNIYFLSESLFSFLLILFFWLIAKVAPDKNQFLLALLLGIVLAITSLTRPWLQYFIFLLVPFIFYGIKKSYSKHLILYLSGAFFFIMAIWLLRTVYVTGSISNNSVMLASILHGMYPDQMYQGNPNSFGFPYRFDPRATEISSSLTALLSEIVSRFQNMPLEHLKWYLIDKPISLLSWDYIQGMGDSFIYPVSKSPYFIYPYFQWLHAFMKTSHPILMLLAISGSIMVWIPQNKANISQQSLFTIRCISLLLIYFILIHLLVAPLPRYTVPLQPLLYGMAIFFLMQTVEWFKIKYSQHKRQQNV